MINSKDIETGLVTPLGPGLYLVSRPKLGGPGTHYGVLETGIQGYWADVVLHLTSKRYEVVSFLQFASQRDVNIVNQVPATHMDAASARVRELFANLKPYSFFDNNCEHVARWVATGIKESKQIDGLKLVGIAAFVCWLLKK